MSSSFILQDLASHLEGRSVYHEILHILKYSAGEFFKKMAGNLNFFGKFPFSSVLLPDLASNIQRWFDIPKILHLLKYSAEEIFKKMAGNLNFWAKLKLALFWLQIWALE